MKDTKPVWYERAKDGPFAIDPFTLEMRRKIINSIENKPGNKRRFYAVTAGLLGGLIALFLIVQLSGLLPGREKASNTQTASPPESSISQTAQPSPSEAAESDNDYAVKVKDTLIPLRGWDYEIDVPNLLGEPIEEKVTQLVNADTFTGSFTKHVRYEGLEMVLFSPKGDGQKFWIMEMKLVDGLYETGNGIRVGMTVADLKAANPAITQALDGRTDPDNCAYELHDIEERAYDFVRYEVQNGKITEIKIYNELP